MKTSKSSALFTSILFMVLFISACKKDKEPDQMPATITVRINEKEYGTMKIGNQTWTVSNYAGPGGILYDDRGSKPEYGKYYTFEEAKGISLPEGWRVPTQSDYIKLLESQGVKIEDLRVVNPEALKTLTSKTNWKHVAGNNLSGFNAFPGGYSFKNSAPMDGDIAEFWMADGNTISVQEGANFSSLRLAFYNNSSSPDYRFNVRFVKDIPSVSN